MNAIISLCHFCEIHGPSILFCTQAFHTHDPQDLECEPPDISSLEDGLSSLQDHLDAKFSGSLDTPTTPQSQESFTKVSDNCEACQSFPLGKPGLISTDHAAKVSYISSQHPHHQQVFSMVRQACLRSLSCEVCPGREGPIFFGDDHRGHVLSHTFFIKDAQARGLQRWYSILVVMMDKIFLLNSWPFLVAQTRAVIDKLQDKAKVVYEKENSKCPQRSHRLTMSVNPSNFLHQRGGGIKSARSLIELTDDKMVFCKLHRSFTWILKAGGSRLCERLLEGPPTEDTIIDYEKQEGVVSTGCVKLDGKPYDGEKWRGPAYMASEPCRQDLIIPLHLQNQHKQSQGLPQSVTQPVETTLYSAKTEEGFVNIFSMKDVMEEKLEEGDSGVESESSEGGLRFTNIRHLLRVLGYMEFHKLAHHVIIGNQIIIRGHNKTLVRSIIDKLKVLLPRGCCRAIYFSSQYIDSWRCNFLGMPLAAKLPKHASLYVILDIENRPETMTTVGVTSLEDAEDPGMEGAEATNFDPDRDPLQYYKFTVTSPMCMPEKAPAVLCSIEQFILNENLMDSVVDQCLISLKEEWMNKVKVLFKFTKAGGSRSDEDTRRLLQVVEANEEDKAVLKFWMTGLSVQYRNHMLSSAIHQAVDS